MLRGLLGIYIKRWSSGCSFVPCRQWGVCMENERRSVVHLLRSPWVFDSPKERVSYLPGREQLHKRTFRPRESASTTNSTLSILL